MCGYLGLFACLPVHITSEIVTQCQRACMAKRQKLSQVIVSRTSGVVSFECEDGIEYGDWIEFE